MRFLVPLIGSLGMVMGGLVILVSASGDLRILGWLLLALGVFFASLNEFMRRSMR